MIEENEQTEIMGNQDTRLKCFYSYVLWTHVHDESNMNACEGRTTDQRELVRKSSIQMN